MGQIHAGVGNRAMLQLILFQISIGVGLYLISLEGFIMIRATCINNVQKSPAGVLKIKTLCGWTKYPNITYLKIESQKSEV